MEDRIPISEIRRTSVDFEAIQAFDRERQHFRVAFDLLRETAQWAILLGSAYAGEVRDWTVREAVLGGHLIRLGKLLRAFLEQSKDHRGEIAWVTTRLITECAINLQYLLENKSDELIVSYLHQSLQHERELRDTILTNIEARGGERLPIEERMLRSIDNTFRNSEVAPEDIPTRRIQNWGGKTLRDKARALGMDDVYQTLIGGSSRNVHGSWQDLLQHHVEAVAPGRFRPRLEEAVVRPQPFYSLARLLTPTFIDYVRSLGTVETERIVSRLQELDQRVTRANELHEEFLVRRQRGPA